MPPLRPLVAAVLALLCLAAPAAGAPAHAKYLNPVLDGNFPDPSVVRLGDTYWAVTTATTLDGLPLLRSTDLVHWQLAGRPLAVPPKWPAAPLWAPELVPTRAGVSLYYASHNRAGQLCVGVATAPSIAAPYRNRGAIQCDAAGAIDPSVARDRGGRPWLLWKEDGNNVGRRTRIWARRLTADGLRAFGARRLLLADTQPWQRGIVEAPEVVRHGGWFYMFFSGGACCVPRCDYAMGVARSRSLLGPWREYARNPILRGNRSWRCPGHGSLVQDPRGRWFLVYHAVRNRPRPPLDVGGAPYRSLLVDEVRWTASGWPEVNGSRGPSASSNALGKRRPPSR